MKHHDANVRRASPAGPRRVQPLSSARSAAVFPKQRQRSLLEGPALFDELRALDIRLSRIAASIPFLGLWLIPWRGQMTPVERKRISKISLTATGLGILAVAALVFDASSRSLPREKRALSDIQDLGDIVQEFRIRNGAYPDWTMWQRTLEQGDPRYYDPWGAPISTSFRGTRYPLGRSAETAPRTEPERTPTYGKPSDRPNRAIEQKRFRRASTRRRLRRPF